MNILHLTRKISNNSNSIYNSYTNGVCENFPNTIVIDFIDLYFELGKKKFEQYILEIIVQEKIQIVFINMLSGDLTFDIYFLKKIEQKVFLILNFYDTELFFEEIDRYYAQVADLVLIPSSKDMVISYHLLNLNCKTIYSPFDSSEYINKNLEKDIDVSFVGNINKSDRKEYIDFLIDNGIKVEVFGNNTKNGLVSFDEMINIFNRSKINLNFNSTIDKFSFDYSSNTDYSMVPKICSKLKQLKGRVIEVSMCGGFSLSQDSSISELFNCNEIGTFDSKNELLDKVNFYLSNNDIREEKAKKSYEKSIEIYDSKIVFKKLFSEIYLDDKKEKIIYLDKVFLKNYVSYHYLYFFNFLFKKRFSLVFNEFIYCLNYFPKLKTVYSHFKQQYNYQIKRKK